jgi:hypothetical protein
LANRTIVGVLSILEELVLATIVILVTIQIIIYSDFARLKPHRAIESAHLVLNDVVCFIFCLVNFLLLFFDELSDDTC